MSEDEPLWKQILSDWWHGMARCPYCSNMIRKNQYDCSICGSNFEMERKWKYEDKYAWPHGRPQIRKILPAILPEYDITEEGFDELFNKVPPPISPEAFITPFIKSEYGWQKKEYQGPINNLTLEQGIRYVLPLLPENAETYSGIYKVVETKINAEYSSYLIDSLSGGGWLPPCDYAVGIEPFVFQQRCWNRRNEIWAIEYDIWFEQCLENKLAAHTISSDSLHCFDIVLSSKDDITPTQMEHFWSSLQDIKRPVIFEIIGNGSIQKIVFQFICHSEDRGHIANQLMVLFPNSSINPEGKDDDFLAGYKEQFTSEYQSFGTSFGLTRHYSYPLRALTSFDKTDPLNSLLNPLSEMGRDEIAVIQALVCPSKYWKKQLDYIGQLDMPLFKDCPVQQKLKYPLFAVCFRAMAFGKKGTSDSSKLKSFPATIETTLASLSLPENNKISRKLPDGHEQAAVPYAYKHVTAALITQREILSVFERNTYRHGFILNSQELASLLHFPSKALQHPKLLRQESAIVKAPEAVTKGEGLLVGINEVFGQSQQVYVPEDFRFRHIYIVGKTGTGKTTLLLNMIKADIDAGKGVGLIDPHGDLVERILKMIPEGRIGDVILFDPTDYDHPIGFNMFQVSSSMEKRQMKSDIVVAIRRLFESSSWGDNIDQLFGMAVATLLADSIQRHTILDIRKLISDDVFRSQVLERIKDGYLREFWVDDFPSFTQSTIAAVKRRLASILGEPEVRGILGQSRTSFSFKEMMDAKKIFLANLSRGELGENISGLFGGLLVSKVQLTAMARASQPEEERVPFYLYVDEFQNFVNESFEVILSEARKYRLCLTMAHQFTGQLPSRLYDAVFGNVGTLITFEIGVDDATALEKQLGRFTRDDIINLERYHTLTRIGKARETFSMRTLPPPERVADFSDRIRQASRGKYCSAGDGQVVEEEQGKDEKVQMDDFFERIK